MRIGIIGCGNMGGAMMSAILEAGECKTVDMMVADHSEELLARRKAQYGIQITRNNEEAAEFADLLILAVKPQFCEAVIEDIKESVSERQVIVSIVPGKTLEWWEEKLGKKLRMIRAMPNTPAMVKAGMTGLCPNQYVKKSDLAMVRSVFSSFSKTEVVTEDLMDVVTAVSGSSPAYVFMFIEAMADAGVAQGMPRDKAYKFAAQAVLGSAKMVLDTKKHPGELKDMVCTPKGTTIEAVRMLEEKGFRSAVIEAVNICVEVGRNM